MDGVCPAAEGTGCGVRGSLTNPPPGGPQGEDHRGACVTLLTLPHPQGGRDFQGCWAGPGSPHLCCRGRVGRVLGRPGTRLLGAGMGAPEQGDVCGVLHTVSPGASRSAWAGPWRAKNGHPLPHGGREAGLSSPRLGGTSTPPPGGRKAWGSTHNADPHSCSGAAGSSGPLSRQTLGFGV